MLLINLCVLYGNTTWVCIITNQYICCYSYEIIANMLCSSSSDYFQLQLITSSLPASKLFHLCPDVEHLRNVEPYKFTHEISRAIWGAPVVWRLRRKRIWCGLVFKLALQNAVKSKRHELEALSSVEFILKLHPTENKWRNKLSGLQPEYKIKLVLYIAWSKSW